MEVVIAEVVLSVSLELLLKKLASSDLWKYARQEKIEVEVNSWKKNLKKINKLLDDAENKQTDDTSVREWLAKLRDLAYDVDDLLDDFNYEMTKRELMPMVASGSGDGAGKDDVGSSSSKVRKFFMPSCCNNFSPRQAMRNVEMGRKMEEITRRLETISGQKGDLGLENLKREIEGARAASDRRPIPPPLAHEAWVFGRGEDKKKIAAMLLNSPHDDEHQGGIPNPNPSLSVVSIVGMGGMGKTTLAGLVYNDVQTPQHFSLKAWVCVSDPFNLETVTRQILSCIDPSKKDLQSLHQVQETLSDRLKGERFLIVLDDVWTQAYDDWNSLRSPLLNGASGSKILVTSRDRKVATMMGGDQSLYELNRLSEDDCWSVFQIHAFQHRNVDDHRTLEPIGREIIKKCGGSPLAATALGGLLCRENRESEWKKIIDSKIWNLSADECQILPALTLSYTRLPSYLKRCFVYCAIFPKDYEFDKEELILLWMAEGLLIQPSNDDQKEMEDVGSDYFNELCSRSFFQSSTSNRSRYTMHDLINDLANFVAKDTCLHLDDKLKNDLPICPISQTIRHSSITRDRYDSFDKFERFCNKENLRTFMILPIDASGWSPSFISNKVVLELIPRMRHLRVLSLSNYDIREIPYSFGELKHLRYLNLSNTAIRCLPNSIDNLYNLQTLILSHCSSLTQLPTSIGTLTSLRCLDVRGAYRLEEMPAGIRKLEHLRILPKLIVGGSNTNLSFEDLRSMPALRGGELRISILENVGSIQDVIKEGLKLIQNLETLEIRWESESNDVVESNDKSVLGFLEPNVNLENLLIQAYSAPRFPRWVNDVAKFNKMVKLSLVDCRKCEYLPCLGLLASLEDLYIQGIEGVKVVGPEFYGCTGGVHSPSPLPPTFKALKSLSFVDMPNWVDWSSPSSSLTQSSSPCLLQLTIRSCPKLIKQLPACLPSLTMLYIEDSPKFEAPLLRLSSLRQLDVRKCNVEALRSGIDLTSLTRLIIHGISKLINLQQGFVGFLGALQDLTISACPRILSLWEDGGRNGWDNLQYSVGSSSSTGDGHQLVSSLGLGCNLKSLEIYNCERMERLPNGWHLVLTCLERLSISLCPELVSFPNHGFPPMLRDVTLGSCGGLKHLPDAMMMITTRSSNKINNSLCRLECLRIKCCPSLTCFPKGQLPTTLKELIIVGCEKLDSLPDGMMVMTNNTSTGPGEEGICCSQLEYLEVCNCPSLTCFPNGSLPTTLKQLEIGYCRKLESLPEGIMQQQSTNPSLEILKLSGCSSLTSFPQGSFPSTLRELVLYHNPQLEPISGEILFHHSTTPHDYSLLQSLSIEGYPNLRTLPADSLCKLTSLTLIDCENLEFEHNQFRNLTRLTSLEISDCGNIKRPLSQWGLAILPSLQSLSIQGLFPDAYSFSDTTDHHQCYSNNHPLLPPTLTSLQISWFEKLESLASLSFQTLTSLKSLSIWNCPKLRSIWPTEAVFPNTIGTLSIWTCPLLEECYACEKGEYWPQIAHIPHVDIRYDSPRCFALLCFLLKPSDLTHTLFI